MSLLPVYRCAVLLLVSGLIVASPAGSAIAKDSEKKSPPPKPTAKGDAKHRGMLVVGPAMNSATAKINETLDQDTVISFVETPLQDVVGYLKDFHKVEIQLDKKALDDAGLGTDTPVTRELGEISLRSALELMLHEFDLTWIIDHEVLIITTLAAANERREIRIYNVADLIRDSSVEELGRVVGRSLVREEDEESGADLSIVPYRDLLIVRHSQPGHRQVTDLLMQLQRALVHREK
jgi:hypothetical protein